MLKIVRLNESGILRLLILLTNFCVDGLSNKAERKFAGKESANSCAFTLALVAVFEILSIFKLDVELADDRILSTFDCISYGIVTFSLVNLGLSTSGGVVILGCGRGGSGGGEENFLSNANTFSFCLFLDDRIAK